MMATEAASEILATTSVPDVDLNQTHDVTTKSTPSEPSETLVNGTEQEVTADNQIVAEDTASPVPVQVDGTNEHATEIAGSAEASTSGGSDTEKAATEKGHARTASTVKKFASFKTVSVNKTFLASKGATSTAPKPGDKAVATSPAPTTSTLAAPRPRLVAKTASGLRDSIPRSSTTGPGGSAAPDASAVWNKNRPVPPPEPKRFTDEELKQRYGIHLATRLQADDPINGKQANWADIDDDDDDWAPATIEWTDGTKITLPQADDAPVAVPEFSASPALKDVKGMEVAKPKSPAPAQASASPTVKPSGFGSGRAGLVLKGASEKPTLVAKPPGPPTPVKSPWASLPAVDKVAPVTIDIPQQPQQQSQSRFNQRDPHGFQGMPPPAAKEIAADDFSRTWREAPSNASRELYNSQSGRYEPVNDNRRGSVRNEQHSRGPALLHRPSQQDGPAEPSAAFQTHRAGGQDGGYGRRRTSSNVSGGSGAFTRRMSRGHDMPSPHDMMNARRGSLAAVSDDPSSPRNFSPSGQSQGQNQRGYQNQSWQSRASPVVSHPSPHSSHGQPILQGPSVDGQSQPSSAVMQEDPIEAQKKLMRHSREQAIKRRQDEEAREEAAKQERIRLKLEALGPAPEKKTKKETPKEEKSVPIQIQVREAETKAENPKTSVLAEESKVKTSERAEIRPTAASDPEDTRPYADSRSNDIHPGANTSIPSNNQASQDTRPPHQSWQNNSASTDRYNSWGGTSTQQPSTRNVWGPPSNDRTLGNGTFNPELGRPEMSSSTSHPGPIGPPNSNRAQAPYQQGRGREYGSRPAPIGPPNRQANPPRNVDPRLAASGWGDAPQKIQAADRKFAQQQNEDLAQRRELQESGLAPEAAQPVYKDTWRQVTLNEDGTRSKIQANRTALVDSEGKILPPVSQEEPNSRPHFEDYRLDTVGRRDQAQYGSDAWKSTSNGNAPPPARGSRFFPNSNRDVRLEDPQVNFDRPGSPTPPPPTMVGHPAYDGDIAHPHVSLPPPLPVVKLPPPVLAPIGPPKPVSFAAAVTAPAVPHSHNLPGRQDYGSRAATHDIRREQPCPGGNNWQDRISSLLGRKSSPPKSHALAVNSSSRHALELPTSQFPATVSLPSSVTGDLAADDSAVLSKPAAEQCFEEQEMGSLPRVKVPHKAPGDLWNPAPPPNPIHRRLLVNDATSAVPLQFPKNFVQNGTAVAVNIHLPYQAEAKTVNAPNPRQRSNPRRGASRGASRQASSSRGGRGRDSAGNFPSSSMDSASISSSPNSRGGHRGNGRGYSGNWNRHVPTPVHT